MKSQNFLMEAIMKKLNSELHRLAIRYFKKKIPVIPVEDKEARLSAWSELCNEFPGQQKINNILEKFKKPNITGYAIPLGPCSGLIAVDVDSTNEEELKIIYDLLPESPIVKIGKKGETRFYKYNGENEIKSIRTKHGTAIEFFGNRKYTVIPPSRHPDTKVSYRWKDIGKTILKTNLTSLPVFPNELWNEIERKLKPEVFSFQKKASANLSGGRNDQLKSMAVAMLAESKKTLKKIAAELDSYDKRNHSPPLFSDKDESVCVSQDSLTNAIKFVANIEESVEGKIHHISRQSPQKINVLSLGEFLEEDRFPVLRPIVEGLVNAEELHLFSAAAKSGKTMLQINLAIAVASGTPFLRKFKTHKGKVLIIQTEVSEGNFQKRVRKIVGDDYKEIKNSILISNNRPKIDTEEGLLLLDQIIKEHNPLLVILDPLYTLHTSNEDSSSEIAPVLTNLREVIIKNKTSCLLIHHQGKGGGTSANVGHRHRGSSSLADVPDANWSLNKTSDPKVSTLSLELRNEESPLPMKIIRGDDLRFSYDGYAMEVKATVDSISEILEESGELTSSDLNKIIRDKFDVSKRTAQNKINDAKEANLIRERKDGKNVFYSSVKGKTPYLDDLHSNSISADVKSVGAAPLRLRNNIKNPRLKKGATT